MYDNNTKTLIEANSAFNPRIYYMVAWLECEWVITYTVFHPIDWNKCNELPIWDWFDSHENDSESAIIYVSRTDFSINQVSGIFHHEVKSTTSPTLISGTHPLMKVDNETHAIAPWPQSTGGGGCQDAYDYLCIYSLSTASPPAPSITLTEDSDGKITGGVGSYDLVSIFAPGELWSQKDNPLTATQTKFVGDNGSGINVASLPWAYSQLPLCEPAPSGSGQCDLVFSQCAPQGKHLIVDEDMIILDEIINEYTSIIIKEQANLTIRNSIIEMQNLGAVFNKGSIIVNRGSTLEIDNSTITSCSDNNWFGIILELNEPGAELPALAPNLTIINGSIIEKSIHGVHHRYEGLVIDDFPDVGGNSSNIFIAGSTFRDNGIGVNIKWSLEEFYGFPFPSSNIIGANTFINNDIAIKLDQCKHIEIYQNEFTNNRIGINASESFIEVSNGNKFISNEFGILLEGTFPLSAGGIIGDQGTGYNEFENNLFGIQANGVDDPIGLFVNNNLFTGTHIVGIQLPGANKTNISFNSFEEGQNGIALSATGGNFNMISCNEHKASLIRDNYISGINNETQILGNALNSVLSPSGGYSNIDLYDATLPNQGKIQNPAGNCFQDDQTIDITKTDDTDQFQYRYYDDSNEDLDMDGVIDDCQTPYSLPLNWLNVSTNKHKNCENDQVGIFGNIIGNPNGDPGIFVSNHDPSTICGPCIKNEIDNTIIRLVNLGGDDPTTYIDEEVYTNDVISYESLLLDEWINYGLYYALANQDFQFAIDILTPLQAWDWQIRLFGIYMLQYDYANAQTVLNYLPSNTANEVNFKIVQQVNLNSLTHTGVGPYVLNSQDEQILETIGLGNTPSSGYARSLYHKLKKEILPFVINNGPRSTPRVALNESLSNSKIEVYPNPSFGVIELSNIEHLVSYEVYNLQGQLITSDQIRSSKIDLSLLENGLYFLITTDDENVENTFKIIIEK